MTDRITDLEQQIENLRAALDNEKRRYGEAMAEVERLRAPPRDYKWGLLPDWLTPDALYHLPLVSESAMPASPEVYGLVKNLLHDEGGCPNARPWLPESCDYPACRDSLCTFWRIGDRIAPALRSYGDKRAREETGRITKIVEKYADCPMGTDAQETLAAFEAGMTYRVGGCDNAAAILDAISGKSPIVNWNAPSYAGEIKEAIAREVWAAIRQAVDEGREYDVEPTEQDSYCRGRREAVDQIRDLAEAELRRKPRAISRGWLPIETAPRHGNYVRAWLEEGVLLCPHGGEATHWYPLPPTEE